MDSSSFSPPSFCPLPLPTLSLCSPLSLSSLSLPLPLSPSYRKKCHRRRQSRAVRGNERRVRMRMRMRRIWELSVSSVSLTSVTPSSFPVDTSACVPAVVSTTDTLHVPLHCLVGPLLIGLRVSMATRHCVLCMYMHDHCGFSSTCMFA